MNLSKVAVPSVVMLQSKNFLRVEGCLGVSIMVTNYK
jgi:hypothetical protein